MIRLAVLGAGRHSRTTHARALRAYAAAHPGEVELAAICDLDLERARAYAAEFGFTRAYDDLEDMLAAERPDGLIAVTPLPLTREIGGRLLRAGIPLVLEKPPGVHSGETEELLAIAEETGTPHMISFNRRFSPAIARAREWLAAHADRPPRLLIARMVRHDRREADFITGTGIHLIDCALSLLGEPSEVTAVNLPSTVAGAFFTQACLRFPGGRRAHLFISPVAGMVEETYELHGEDYTLVADTMACALRVWDNGREVLAWRAPEDAGSELRDGTLGETAAFIAAVRAGAGFSPTLRDGLCSMRAAEAIARASG